VLKDKAHPLRLEVNWQKTKIQSTIHLAALPTSVLVPGNPVDAVESFVYLDSEIHTTCSNQLNREIWRCSISICTKVPLYHVYIQPILLYGSETWALTRALKDRIAAFDNICLRRILRILYTDHVTNADVRLRAGCPPQLLLLIQTRRLRFFGHVTRMGDFHDLFRALHTSIRGLAKDWRQWRTGPTGPPAMGPRSQPPLGPPLSLVIE